jgi:two-component system, NarL family, nitrate/nitrite response regulator NarL
MSTLLTPISPRRQFSLTDVEEKLGIVLVEDHPLYREGLKTFIKTSFPTATLHYEGADIKDAKDACEKKKVSIAIVDLHLGDGRSPSEIVSMFTSIKVPVLVISALSSFESVKTAFSMGAKGFVSKDSATEELKKAIKSVAQGNEWISPVMSQALAFDKKTSDDLSNQERKALVLYASGLKLDAVARRMGVAPSTVKQYIERAKMKYRIAGKPIRTKTDMYRTLRDEGIIE